MVAPLQTASLLWVQQAAVILPGNSRSLARQLSSRAVFHHYRSQRHAQRSTLTVVRWSETPRNHVGPPEHSNPVVRWTTEIFSSKQNRNMAKKSKQSSPLAADNTRNTVPLLPLFTEQNKCL